MNNEFDERDNEFVIWLDQNRNLIENRTKLRIGNLLGKGDFGYVFYTDDERWVIKISFDGNEAILFKLILDLRSKYNSDGFGPSKYLPGIVFIKSLFITDYYQDEYSKPIPAFVIVREFVSDKKSFPRKNLKAMVEIFRRLVKYAMGSTVPELEYAIKGYKQAIIDIKPYSSILYDTLMECLKNNLILGDVYLKNIGTSVINWGNGYRSVGQEVIFDMGGSALYGGDRVGKKLIVDIESL